MCRLYGFQASEPTKVECTLVHAQNALMVQSREDLSGKEHGHGWGIATYEDHLPQVERQAWAAYHGEHFRRAAARIFTKTVVAHVRRATVGEPRIENTHPFTDGTWTFVHNGTVPNFPRVRERLAAEIAPGRLAAIRGDTDSEHVFQLLRTLMDSSPELPLRETLCTGLRLIVGICRDVDPDALIGLNVILTDGRQIVGSRIGRTLFGLERIGVHDCEICGFPHVRHDPHTAYRAAIVASEPISHEDWKEIAEGSVWEITRDHRICIEPLW